MNKKGKLRGLYHSPAWLKGLSGSGSKFNLPALNLVAQNLPETEISGAPTEVAGKGSDARTALAKNGMRGAGQLPYLGKFCSKFGT